MAKAEVFCKLLDLMLADEQKAGTDDYEKLREALEEAVRIDGMEEPRLARAILASIEEDEKKHYIMLSQIKSVLC